MVKGEVQKFYEAIEHLKYLMGVPEDDYGDTYHEEDEE